MSKLTATEWLCSQIIMRKFNDTYYRFTERQLSALLREAKNMERKQILDAYCQDNNAQCLTCEQDSEEYYSRTYER